MKKALSRSNRAHRPSREEVHDLVASVLAFLATDAERFDRFLAVTGLTVTNLRAASAASGFAESLVDYLCSDERLLLAYAGESGREPATIEAVRLSLAPPPFDV